MAQIGGVVSHGTADLETITEQHRPQLSHQLLTGIGPAAVAAFTHATGKRIRDLPFTADRVKEALA